ncbi:hypothetical protein CLV59_11373 [Chitinophaga dinghuensis]|uniref:Uncharacterized protein n=1 Tax=Chitinophaga dinghuensis TaxID=1539050 RepID=A0A327VKY6_9BACT|nr:hypothetical protein CLV59_11373 [Chitinophaga dinghuensis]
MPLCARGIKILMSVFNQYRHPYDDTDIIAMPHFLNHHSQL